jgi:hypothetical protein
VRRGAAAAAALAVLSGCGGHAKPSTYERENTALLGRVPIYPGARSPETSSGGGGGTQFAARDWTLPRTTDAETVAAWYVQRLRSRGWRITGKNPGTVRAVRGQATLTIGVRARTLEVIANARGA